MNFDNKNKKYTEDELDAKNKISLELDEKFSYPDNYTMTRIIYDTSHGKSIYSDDNSRYELGYDSEDDGSIQELKKKLVNKFYIITLSF